MKLLRRACHVASILVLLLAPACALAQTSRPPQREQDAEAAKRQQEGIDQLRSIAAEIKAIRSDQSAADQRASEHEAQHHRFFTRENASQWVLAVFAAIAAILAARTLKANAVAAESASEQARLTRQQLVGTLAAIVSGHPSMNDRDGLTINVGNLGEVNATDVTGIVRVIPVVLPDLVPLNAGTLAEFGPFIIGHTDRARTKQFKVDMDRSLLPSGKWDDAFAANPRTLMVVIDGKYNNGFGDTVPFTNSYTYIPSYNYRQRDYGGSASGGGSFAPSENVAMTWKHVNYNQYRDTQQGEAKGKPN